MRWAESTDPVRIEPGWECGQGGDLSGGNGLNRSDFDKMMWNTA